MQDGYRIVSTWVRPLFLRSSPTAIADTDQVANRIGFLDDISQFYKERSAIEKEYSAKLSLLAKKYYEKKTKKSASLSVGDTPTVTPGSLER